MLATRLMACPFRHRFQDQLDLLDVVDAENAVSTIGAVSSPPRAMEDESDEELVPLESGIIA